MSTVRRRVIYSGRVQGVGFRDTSQRLAERHSVGGYVRNLADGRVELIAEGEPSQVDAFLNAIQRRMDRYIGHVHVVNEPADDPPLVEFSIRF